MNAPQLITAWNALPRSGPGSASQLAADLGVPGDQLHGKHAVFRAEVWVEVVHDEYEQWRVAFRLAVQAGQLVVAELRVFPVEQPPQGRHLCPGLWSAEVLGARARVPLGGLPGRLLRGIRIGQPVKHTRGVLRWLRSREGALDPFQPGPLSLSERGISEMGLGRVSVEERGRRPRRPARRGRPDIFLAQLAAAYVRAVERGDRRPIRRLAAQRRTEPTKIRDMLHEARERDLLTRGIQGKSGGALTLLARALLAATKRTTTRRRARR